MCVVCSFVASVSCFYLTLFSYWYINFIYCTITLIFIITIDVVAVVAVVAGGGGDVGVGVGVGVVIMIVIVIVMFTILQEKAWQSQKVTYC